MNLRKHRDHCIHPPTSYGCNLLGPQARLWKNLDKEALFSNLVPFGKLTYSLWGTQRPGEIGAPPKDDRPFRRPRQKEAKETVKKQLVWNSDPSIVFCLVSGTQSDPKKANNKKGS